MGGAGYIGSHVLRQPGEAGERMVTLDDLATGKADAAPYATWSPAPPGIARSSGSYWRTMGWEAVMHFAASMVVPEWVEHPLAYYSNNTFVTHVLREACVKAGAGAFLFSSTAAVYGIPGRVAWASRHLHAPSPPTAAPSSQANK
ncbi:MAG: NAD-dependent epimerase/dehydratase family protein [Thiohalorhabdus sp.]|uniref:NAD-dependent epimerase/dehydratase family protein n=1 Tax=Thiohalorhabdus sp. TaxID=3094134 RepID=UPI002FC33419